MSRVRFLADHDLNEHIPTGVARREPLIEFLRVRKIRCCSCPSTDEDCEAASISARSCLGTKAITRKPSRARRSRFFNSRTDPFRDPIYEAGGINLYAFVENDPLSNTDPNGLESFSECFKTCVQDTYGDSFDISFGLSFLSPVGVAQDLWNKRVEKAAGNKLKDLALAGAKEQGTIIDKMNAAERAALKARSLSRSTKVLGFLGKASGVVGAFATGYVAGAAAYCGALCAGN